MLIIHGENIVQSRKTLQQELDAARAKGIEITRLEVKKLSPTELQENLGATSLFGTEKLFVIEELHSLPPSERKKLLIEILAEAADQQIILWEKRSLTATMIKKLGGPKNLEFKVSNDMFSWLDSLGSPNKKTTLQAFHKALKQEDEHLCFIMLARQVRLLIQAKDNEKIAGPPFMISKLKKQSQSFTMESLLNLHSKLVQTDLAIKQSKLRLSIAGQLDLLQLGM